MNKTLLFFKPVVYRNDVPTTIHITSILDEIVNRDAADLLKNVNRKGTALKRLKVYDQGNNNPLDRGFSIAIYREDKPYIGHRNTQDINEIPDDVMELTNCVYFEAYRILCIEYNHVGVRSKAIRDYLSEFLPLNEQEGWSLLFHQIRDDDELQDLRRSMDIKSIRFLFNPDATDDQIRNTLAPINRGNDTAVLNNLIDATVETNRAFGGKNEITLKKARGAQDIDFINFIHIIDNMNIDEGLFTDVFVKYKPRGRVKNKTINLIESGMLKYLYQTDVTGWEAICDDINRIFFEENRIGINKPSDAPPLQELREVDMPELI